METTPSLKYSNRVIFMDNLRYLMVLLVVVLHASVSYCNLVPWWAVRDRTSTAMDILLVGLDIFLMPVLFFIAGYFSIPSFRCYGAGKFIKKKFKRLGIPLLISAPITGCLFAYIYHTTRGSLGSDSSLLGHWLIYLGTALEFHIGQIPAINHFSHSHLWFMSVLLFFFLLYALLRSMRPRKTVSGTRPSAAAISKNILATFAIVGLGSALSMVVGTFVFARPENPEPWFIIANVVQFQPHKLIMYALYFGMGIYAHRTHWFSFGSFPGNIAIWSLSSLVLFIAMLVTLKEMMSNFSPGLLMVWLLMRSFCCLSILGMFLTFSVRRWNRPGRLDALLSANSYHIYILHFIVVLLLQLMLLQWTQGPVLIKFCIVSVAAIAASLGLSHYLFKPYPVFGTTMVYVLFSIGLVMWHPAAS